MKRSHLFERPEEEQEQARVAALVASNVVFAVEQIPPLVDAFRFHPWRLLRLMGVSRSLRHGVNRAAKQNPRLWYDCCVAAFPDFIVLLQVYLQATPTIRTLLANHATLDWHATVFQQQAVQTSLRARPFVAELIARLVAHDPTVFSSAETRLDASFHDPVLLQACLRDHVKGREAARCFKLLFPAGVPPAHYCFASQMALHRLTLEFLAMQMQLAPDTDDDNPLGPDETFLRRYSMLSVMSGFDARRAEAWVPYVTLQFVQQLEDPSPAGYYFEVMTEGSGPRLRRPQQPERLPEAEFGADDQAGRHVVHRAFSDGRGQFTLWDLLWEMRDFYEKIARLPHGQRVQEALKTNGLYERVAAACVRYHPLELAPYSTTLPTVDDRDTFVVDVAEQRSVDMARYGTHDPLYWSVLASGEEDTFGLLPQADDWKQVIRHLIDIVKENGRDTPLYQGLQASVVMPGATTTGEK